MGCGGRRGAMPEAPVSTSALHRPGALARAHARWARLSGHSAARSAAARSLYGTGERVREWLLMYQECKGTTPLPSAPSPRESCHAPSASTAGSMRTARGETRARGWSSRLGLVPQGSLFGRAHAQAERARMSVAPTAVREQGDSRQPGERKRGRFWTFGTRSQPPGARRRTLTQD